MSKSFVQKVDHAAKQQGRLTRYAALMSITAILMTLSLLVVLVDYLGRFNDPGLRWLSTASLLVLAFYLLIRSSKQIWHSTPSQLTMAQKIEADHPSLGSRLSSAIAFYDQTESEKTAGSEELRRAVVIQTDNDIQNTSFNNAINRVPFYRSSKQFCIVLAATVGLFVFSFEGMSQGYARLFMPWAEAPWPRINHLVLSNPPTKITQGETIEIICHDEQNNLPDDLSVEFRTFTDSGYRIESESMAIVGTEGIASRQNIQSPLEFRVVGGDDNTMAWYSLEVLEPPKIQSLAIKVFPPSYTGISEYESTGRLDVLAGSSIALNASSNQELSSAQIEFSNGDTIQCQQTEEDSSITVDPKDWKVLFKEELSNASWWLKIQSSSGSITKTDKQTYRVVKDEAPTLKWKFPEGDNYLTSRALLPIEVIAEDDLAISECWIEAKVSSMESPPDSESDLTRQIRQSLLERIADPPAKESFNKPEQSTFSSIWDLQLENLPAGTKLDLVARALDFLPQDGSTSLPRRIFLVTDEEYQARLAKKQSRLLSALQETIDRQRSAYELTEALANEIELNQNVDRRILDQLASAEFEQRQTANQLSNPLGVIPTAKWILEDIRRNRLDNPDLETPMENALKQLNAISNSEMPASKNDLAEARRSLERDQLPSSKESLQSAISNQLDSTEQLEKIAKSLTGWSDFQRLSQELASIEDRQRKLAERSAKLSRQSASSNPLQRVDQQIERKQIATEQAENNRRFNQIQQTLSDLLSTTEASKRSESQDAASDALQEAEERNIAAGMRNASSRLARNQLGRAAQQQQQSADDLREMLETLRSRANNDPEQLIAKLQEANRQLKELEEQALRESDSTRPDTNQSEQLAKEADRMARKLDRLTAQTASQKASQAADSASRSAENQSPSAQSDLQQSAQSLNQAQEEVDKRIAELEQEQAERLLDQLERELPRFQKAQQAILDATKIASDEPKNIQRQVSPDLQKRQHLLQEEVDTFSNGLSPKPIFQHALAGATGQMQVASGYLLEERLGRPTQRSEYLALQRLKQIEQVLKTHREQNEEQQQGNGGGGQNGEPPEPLPFEVAELKMLRLMQLELIDQTRTYEADRAQAVQSGRFDDNSWNSEAKELSNEQNELSELALEIANRDNEP